MNRHRKGFGDHKPRLAQSARARKASLRDLDHPLVQRGCTDKRKQFNNRLHARDGARAASKEHGVKLTFYRCKYCPGFHLTKADEPKPKMIVIESPVWHPTLLSLVGTIVKPMVRRIA